MPKARHHRQVSRDSVIPIVTGQHGPKPFPGVSHRIVHSLAQLDFNSPESRSHPLGYSPTLHLELPFPALSTDVRQSQEIKRLGWSLPTLFPILFGEPAELDQTRFLRMQFQPELPQPFRQCSAETFGVYPVLKRENHIVGVTCNEHLASRLLSPLIRPEIQHVMQVHVRQQGRDDSSYAKDNLTFERILKYR